VNATPAPTIDAPIQARRWSVPAPVVSILRAYAQVLFSRSPWIGAALLAASFVVPTVGMVGLVGVMLTTALGRVLQFDREALKDGLLGYNGLLVYLGIGALFEHTPVFWVLAIATSLLVVLSHVALHGFMSRYLNLPVLSLPFVVVLWLMTLASPHMRGMRFTNHVPALDLGAFPGPALLDDFLRAMGAIFFQPHWLAGLLVFGSMLAWSRVATIHAILGFAVAVAADRFLLSFPPDLFHVYVGFNIVLTAVALGGIFYVPSLASLALSVVGSVAAALVSVAWISALQPLGLPVLAAPLNMTVLLALYALGLRQLGAKPLATAHGGSPEENLAWFQTRVRRFQNSCDVPLYLPFRWNWVCTQGNDGEHTHRGPWRHGLDFEVFDAAGNRFEGTGAEPSHFLCHGLPVVAPAAGTVVRIVDGIPDTPVGDVNVEQNWGNAVVLQVGPERYVVFAHLLSGSFKIREGQRVAIGQELAACGSSGRSPIPHLHVQLQATPELGAPTLPIAFDGVVVEGEARHAYVPQEGDVLRGLNPAGAPLAWVKLPPGSGARFEVREGPTARVVSTKVHLDLLGERSIRSGEARLPFNNMGMSFLSFDVLGREPLLLAMYASLARVPLDKAPLAWADTLDARRLRASWADWLRDGLGAIVGRPAVRMTWRSHHDGGRWIVTGSSDDGRVATRAVLETSGIAEVDVRIDDRQIRCTALEPWA